MKKWLSVLFLLFAHLNAFAVHPTQGPLQQHPALCNYGYNPNCGQSTPPPQKIIKYVDVHVPDKYGALASDKNTGNIGDAANANSLAEAKKLALKACAEGGKNKNCKVRSWVKNGCIAAVAGGKRGSESILFPAADVPGKTEYIAMNSCHKAKLPSCKIIVSETCSVPEGMYK